MNWVKFFSADLASQPPVGKDMKTDEGTMIDWDQIREDALKWEKKKWAGWCLILTSTCCKTCYIYMLYDIYVLLVFLLIEAFYSLLKNYV